MNNSWYSAATALFLLLPLLLVGLVLYGLRQVLARSGWGPARERRVWRGTALALLAWLGLTAGLAQSGFLLNFQTLPPRLMAVVLPPLLALIVLSRSAGLRQLLLLTPPAWLLGLQSFRIVVEVGLWWLLLAGAAPVQMTFEGRNFDILTGATAVLGLLLGLHRGPRWALALWNGAGLVVLANIVAIAILSTPSPFRVFLNEPANTFVGQFPFVWLPGLLVPLAYWLHVFSLQQLWATRPRPLAVQ
jgi:hypothetical protein